MLTRSIGKRCDTEGCGLKGQLQEGSLVICPECGTDITDVRTVDRRPLALLALALALVGAATGFVVYGYVARALGPLQMARLLLRQIHISDSIQPLAAGDWVTAKMRFYNSAGLLPDTGVEFLHEEKNGRRTATLRSPLTPDTTISFDVLPSAPGVSSLYLLHLDGEHARLLFGDERAFESHQGAISIPGRDGNGQEMGIGFTGSTTEHFVLIAARKPLPTLDALKAKAVNHGETGLPDADVSAAVSTIERDRDAYVIHLYVPHS